MVRAGWVMSLLAALFLLGASVAPKLVGASVAVDTMAGLGWPPGYVLAIGLVELGCVVLFLVPRTALLGAVLTTALLGGAIATHMRAGSPWATHTLFGVYLGLFVWGALVLRDPALRAYLLRAAR